MQFFHYCRSKRKKKPAGQVWFRTPDIEVIMEMEIENLNDLIQKLHDIFSSDSVNIEYVHQVLTSYKSNPEDWKKFADFDRHRYTRNLVDAGNGKFNLMILCWSESQGSNIHDHSDSHCFMKMLQGELTEVRFRFPTSDSEQTDSMVPIGETTLAHNKVCYINDSLGLHRVENRSHTEPAVSLHLYCPPFDQCHIFDQRTGTRATCKVTFWSKFGERTPFVTTA